MSLAVEQRAKLGIRIAAAGDEAVLVDFGNVISRTVNRRVRSLAAALTRPQSTATGGDGTYGFAPTSAVPWLREVVPAYSSLLVRYDADGIDYDALHDYLLQLLQQGADDDSEQKRLIEIPVHYGGADGPDLAFVAEYTGLTPEEVVALHSGTTYVVYMLGFTPGFCYLGDLPPRLAVERRATPRLALPAGAVAIGGAQTGIYSLDNSPGGWRWIGRTAMPLWDADADPPFVVRAGDEVRFVPA